MPAAAGFAVLPADAAVLGELAPEAPAVAPAGGVALLPAEDGAAPVVPFPAATWDIPGVWTVPEDGVVASPFGVEPPPHAASAVQTKPV